MFKLTVSIFWGINGINKDKVDRWEPKYIGEAIMDENFNLAPVDAQQSLLNLCTELETAEVVSLGQVECWTTDFNQWLRTRYNT